MAAPIEEYALLSDLATGSLVSRSGSVDWLCFPRFDSPSIFGALPGNEDHGRWLLAPAQPDAVVVTRQYLDSTFVVETTWQASSGQVRVTDFMPVGRGRSSLLRRVTRLQGSVPVRQELSIRPHYGALRPWMSRFRTNPVLGGGDVLLAMAGPDAWALQGRHLPQAHHRRHIGDFVVSAGENVDFELRWFPSYREVPPPLDFDETLHETLNYWTRWGGHCRQDGAYGAAVKRSLLVLRALTHYETGGIVAAPTTSLPEDFGGSRNWDYRYCWLRDAALTLEAMLTHGYESEALKWRNWLLRALAGGKEDPFSWALQRALLGYVEKHFDDKDCGLWEVRGTAEYFTHSRVMMWAAFDCGVRAVRDHGLPGPAEHWEELRGRLRTEIMDRGFNRELNSFTQTYGGRQTDAALLALPQVGFLAYADKHLLGTVAQLERELVTEHGLLLRYRTETGIDGLEPGEHPFLACSFWLVEQYAPTNRWPEARALMDTLVGFSNELGLLSEEFAPKEQRMAGNFLQAFSLLALVRAADAMHGVDRLSMAVKTPS